jgi:hypothetical protein
MTISGNVGTGPKDVTGNTVTGNLECSGNQTPFTGSPNIPTKGKITGQCGP